MAFTLALLGTDTNYQTALLPREYPTGETLSVVASLLSHHQSLSPLHDDGVEHLCYQNFHLINGPTTLGSEVFDRIKRGLFACLRAVMAGHTQINIFAHSRGGAESILLAHEMNRIQQLGSDLNLVNIKDSTSVKLKAELQKLSWTEAELVWIKQNLPMVKLSMFVLDPVPGDGYCGLGWYEAGFHSLPPIVSHFEEYIYEHEQTRLFYPIIPKPHGTTGSSYQLQILPGHHGSGSGNPYDQAKLWKTTVAPPQFKLEHTQELQKLVLIKLAYFLIQQGTRFCLSSSLPPYSSEVIAVLNPWMSLVQSIQVETKAIFLDELMRIYDFFVKDNARQTFNLFYQTAYPFLGRLSGDSRFIYYHGDGANLNKLGSQLHDDASYFFNSEHMHCYIDPILSISEDDDPLAYLDKLIIFFQSKMQEDPNLHNLSGSQNVMIPALADAIRKPFINGYYNTQDKTAKLVEKVSHLMHLFIQEAKLENTRSHFLHGLQRELVGTISQRIKNLSKILLAQIENCWELNLLHRLHQDFDQIVHNINLVGDRALALSADFNQFNDQLLLSATNFTAIPGIITAFCEKIESEYPDICKPLIEKLQSFVVQISELSPEHEKMQHHRKNMNDMLITLQQMQDVMKIAEQFDDNLLCEHDKLEQQAQFSNYLRLVSSYFEVHNLSLNQMLDILCEYPDLLSGFIQDSQFLQRCEQSFRQDLLRLRNQPFATYEALKRNYAFLWSQSLSSGLERLKANYEKHLVQLQVQEIIEPASNLGQNLHDLFQVKRMLQQLEQLKAGVAKPKKLEIRRQGTDVIPSVDDLKNQEIYGYIQQTMEEVKRKFPAIEQDLSGWVQILNVELQTYQSQTKTQAKQKILNELQDSVSKEDLDIGKLVHFFAQIHQKSSSLGLHCDPWWLQNLKNFAVIFPSMMMVSGMIAATMFASPVLTVLISVLSLLCFALEAMMIHQTRGHFCFWRSKGDDFVKKIDQIENNICSSLFK